MEKNKPPPPFLKIILDSITEGVFTINKDRVKTSFNQAAETITGFSREEAIGKKCFEIFQAEICQDSCALARTLKTGKNVFDLPVNILNARGEVIPISVTTAVLTDSPGRLLGESWTPGVSWPPFLWALAACNSERDSWLQKKPRLPLEEKQRILDAANEDNVLTDIFTGKPVRVLTSPRLNSLLKTMEDGLSPEETRLLIVELRKKKRNKELGYNSVTSGQGAGLIHKILPAKEIFMEITNGAEALYRRLDPWS